MIMKYKTNYPKLAGILGMVTVLALPLFLSPQPARADTATGLISNWKLDESSGASAADSAGTNTGTLTNGPAWTTGKIGGALSFDSVDDYIDLGNPTSLQLTGAMTVSTWVNTKK